MGVPCFHLVAKQQLIQVLLLPGLYVGSNVLHVLLHPPWAVVGEVVLKLPLVGRFILPDASLWIGPSSSEQGSVTRPEDSVTVSREERVHPVAFGNCVTVNTSLYVAEYSRGRLLQALIHKNAASQQPCICEEAPSVLVVGRAFSFIKTFVVEPSHSTFYKSIAMRPTGSPADVQEVLFSKRRLLVQRSVIGRETSTEVFFFWTPQ